VEPAPITHLFESQLGLIAARQALQAGMTRRQIDHRVERRQWIPVLHGTYRHAAAPEHPDQRLLAAVLLGDDGTAISHRAGVALHGADRVSSDLVEVTSPGRRLLRVGGVVAHRSTLLTPEWVTTARGIPVTTPALTLVQAADVVSAGLVRHWLEEWLVRRLVTMDGVAEAAAHWRRSRQPGADIVMGLLHERTLGDVIPDSVKEGLLAELLLRHGLPLPEHHVLVDHDGTVFAELDWAYVDERVALEFDGYGVHLRSREAWEKGLTRHNDIELKGWTVLHFSSLMLRQRPMTIVSQVRRGLDPHRARGREAVS
jgi:hypothetical protein